jgi:3-phenylpropionate/trans-cinnamate dioxygenase ferredoxin reductase subunit
MTVESRFDVLVVGGGKAASQLMVSLRDDGFTGSLGIIGDEELEPYDRPPLSKEFLAVGHNPDTLLLRPVGFYLRADIEVHVDTTVAAIDSADRTVRLEDGRMIGYTDLVIATGAVGRPLPVDGADLDGVTGLRSLADAQLLRGLLGPGHEVVVIGGGFVGLEVAASAAIHHASKVTVLEFLPRLMSRTALPETSAAAERYQRSIGVDVRLGSSVSRLIGENGRVVAVELADGSRLPADVVVYGVGVMPRADLAVAADLAVDNGIVVDEMLRTSVDHIWAIGDCCSFPSVHAGGQARLESIQNATDQARHLAHELATGELAPYRAVPWFWSDQGSAKIQSVGLVGDRDSTVVVGDPLGDSFSVLAFKEGKLLGGDSMNASGDHLALRRLLNSPATGWESELAQHAIEPGFSLSRFARAALAASRESGS